jgi:hypothetical protein
MPADRRIGVEALLRGSAFRTGVRTVAGVRFPVLEEIRRETRPSGPMSTPHRVDRIVARWHEARRPGLGAKIARRKSRAAARQVGIDPDTASKTPAPPGRCRSTPPAIRGSIPSSR